MNKIFIISNCPGDVLRAAKKLDLEIILINDSIALWQIDLVDHYIEQNQFDYISLLKNIKDFLVSNEVNLIATFDERAVPITAKIAHELGIKHNSFESAYASRNKYEMRLLFKHHGLNYPNFSKAETIEAAIKKIEDIGYPVVLKPLFGFASQGVVRINNQTELEHYFPLIKEIARSHDVFIEHDPNNKFLLIEEYIDGREVAVDAIVYENKAEFIGILDKPIPLVGPTFEETIYITPSSENDSIKDLIHKEVQNGIVALGIQMGPIHAEVRIYDDKAYVIEIASRAIGGVCGRAYTYCLGENYYEIVLNSILGNKQVIPKKTDNKPSGVMMIPVPKAGVIKKIEGIDEARSVQGIKDVFILAKKGDTVHLFPKQGCYLGFIIATGDTQNDVFECLSKAHLHIEFDIK